MRQIDRDALAAAPAALLDIRQVAALLGCSVRTVQRLSERGGMPHPIKLSALVRWRRDELHEWIVAGCPSNTAGCRT